MATCIIHPGLVSLLFMHIKFYALRNILPEAIYYCLHTCCVYVVLSELCYVSMPTFIATISHMGQLYSV